MNSGHGINIPQPGEDYLLGTAKVPPPWNPAWQSRYPYKKWVRDITLWAMATDIPSTQVAANVVLRLGGTAREMCEELDEQQLMHGTWIQDQYTGTWNQRYSGLALLLNGLSAQFGSLDGEASIKSIAECIHFRAGPNEDVDSVVARFSTMCNRCVDEANVDFGHQGRAWLFLTGLQIPPEDWYDLLQPLDGKLPGDEPEFRQMITRIKRRGHMHRRDGIAKASHSAQRDQAGRNNHFVTEPLPSSQHHPHVQTFWQSQQHSHEPYSHDHDKSTSRMMTQHLNSSQPGISPEPMQHDYSMFSDDESVSTATEDDEPTHRELRDLEGYLSHLPPEDHGEILLHEYLAARKRWRSFTGKPTRAKRRFVRKTDRRQGSRPFKPFTSGSGRGRGSGRGNSQLGGFRGSGLALSQSEQQLIPSHGPDTSQSYAQMPQRKFQKTNPTDREGKVMECHKCGSKTHLQRECDMSGPRGRGANVSWSESNTVHYHVSEESPRVHAPLSLHYMTSDVSECQLALPMSDEQDSRLNATHPAELYRPIGVAYESDESRSGQPIQAGVSEIRIAGDPSPLPGVLVSAWTDLDSPDETRVGVEHRQGRRQHGSSDEIPIPRIIFSASQALDSPLLQPCSPRPHFADGHVSRVNRVPPNSSRPQIADSNSSHPQQCVCSEWGKQCLVQAEPGYHFCESCISGDCSCYCDTCNPRWGPQQDEWFGIESRWSSAVASNVSQSHLANLQPGKCTCSRVGPQHCSEPIVEGSHLCVSCISDCLCFCDGCNELHPNEPGSRFRNTPFPTHLVSPPPGLTLPQPPPPPHASKRTKPELNLSKDYSASEKECGQVGQTPKCMCEYQCTHPGVIRHSQGPSYGWWCNHCSPYDCICACDRCAVDDYDYDEDEHANTTHTLTRAQPDQLGITVPDLGARQEAQPTALESGSRSRSSWESDLFVDPAPTALDPPRCRCFRGGAQCQFVRTHGWFCDRCTAHRCMCPCLGCDPWEGDQDQVPSSSNLLGVTAEGPYDARSTECVCTAGGIRCNRPRGENTRYCALCTRHSCVCSCAPCDPSSTSSESSEQNIVIQATHTAPDSDPPPASRSPPTTVPPPARPIPTSNNVMNGMTEVLNSVRATRRHKYHMFPTFPVSW